MPRSRLLGLVAATVATLAPMVALGSALSPAKAVDEQLPVSPTNQILVLSDNIAEAIYHSDNAEALDVNHFSSRVNVVLTALNQPAPDVVLLQESNEESATKVAQGLTSKLGRNYAIAAMPASGDNAKVTAANPPTAGGVVQDTAVIYNSDTMSSPAVTWTGFNAAAASIKDPQNAWWNTRAPLVRLIERSSGQAYLFSSVRFLVDNRLKDPESVKTGWAAHLKDATLALGASDFKYAIPVVGGDFNHHPCLVASASVGDTACDTATEYSGWWRELTVNAPAWKAARTAGIDHIFTGTSYYGATGKVVSTNFDYNYAGRIPDMGGCYADYNSGNGATSTLTGCAAYFYSDHPFYWAVISPS